MHEREIQTRPKRPARGKPRGPSRGTLAGEVLYLQQTAGNAAVTALISQTAVQRRVTGLAQGGQVKAYVAGVKQAKGTWATLKTPAARAQMLGKIANDRLQAAGVFSVAIRIDPTLSPQTSGQFDFTTWSIALNGGLVNQAALTDAQLKSVAGTIYHEARHAEQWFRIARWLAGQGKKAADIVTEMQIAPAAAKAAVASPLAEHGWFFRLSHSAEELEDNQKKLDEAKAWFDNIYGTGGTSRGNVLNALGPDAAAVTAASNAHAKAAKLTAAVAARYQAA